MVLVSILLIINGFYLKKHEKKNANVVYRIWQIFFSFVIMVDYLIFIINYIFRLTGWFRFYKTTLFIFNIIGTTAALLISLMYTLCQNDESDKPVN